MIIGVISQIRTGSSSGLNYSPSRQQVSNFAGKRVADLRWKFQKYRQRSLVG